MYYNIMRRMALAYALVSGLALFGAAESGDIYVKNNTDLDGSWISGSRSNLVVSWTEGGAKKSLVVSPGPDQFIGPRSKVRNISYQNHGKSAGAMQAVGLGGIYSIPDNSIQTQQGKDVIITVNDTNTLTGFTHGVSFVEANRDRRKIQGDVAQFRDVGDLFPRIKAARDERSGQWKNYTVEQFLNEKPHFFLDLRENEAEAEITERYKKLVAVYHPDKNKKLGGLATQAFQLLKNAYDKMIAARKWQQR